MEGAWGQSLLIVEGCCRVMRTRPERSPMTHVSPLTTVEYPRQHESCWREAKSITIHGRSVISLHMPNGRHSQMVTMQETARVHRHLVIPR